MLFRPFTHTTTLKYNFETLYNNFKQEIQVSVKTKYTPSEAIRQIEGLDRKQLYERMSSEDPEHRISYTPVKKKKRTERVIDASELVRVFGDRFKPIEQTTSETTNEKQQPPVTTQTIREISDLKLQVDTLKKQLNNEKEQKTLLENNLDDLRQDKQFLQKQLESQTVLLSDNRARETELKYQLEEAQKPTEKRKGFWAWMARN